jgi:GGDEF domain-containing protein
MGQVRWRVISLLFWMTLFFNIERLDIDIGEIDTINLPTSVYAVGIAVAIAGLMPTFQRRPIRILIALSVIMYVMALFITMEPILGDIHTYLTLTGILLLVVTALLSYNLGQSISEFLTAVEEMTFSDKGGRLRSTTEAQEFVHLEMVSSRRTQRPLSLVMLQADASSMNMLMHRLIQEIQRSMMQRYLMATVARVLSRYMRRTDIIIEGQQPGRLVLLAPETTVEEAEALGERLKNVAEERLGVNAHYSVATFPNQALTYEELLNVAEQRLGDQGTAKNVLSGTDEQISKLAEQQAQEPIVAAPTPSEAQA